jgi:WhiB family transcriptional regulator, redox-sensing transcriptional regulator
MGAAYSELHWERVTLAAQTGAANGQRVTVAIADEMNVSESTARQYATKARKLGYDVPYDRIDMVDPTTRLPVGTYELVAAPEPWAKFGACRGVDTNLFFPTRGNDATQAKAVCMNCPVVDECLDYALRTHQTVGVWGGKSERERRGLRRQVREERVAFYRELIA